MDMQAKVDTVAGRAFLVVNDRRIMELPDDAQEIGRISALAWSATKGNLSAQNTILGILHDEKIDQNQVTLGEPDVRKYAKIAASKLPDGWETTDGLTYTWTTPEIGWVRLVISDSLFTEINVDFKLEHVFTVEDVFEVDRQEAINGQGNARFDK